MIEISEQIQLDTGLQFGKGLFETILVCSQRAIHLDIHLERLNADLKKIGIRQYIEHEMVKQVIAQIGDFHDHPVYVLKLIITEKNKLALPRLYPYTEEDFKRGFKLTLSPIRRNETSPTVFLKTLNYLDNLIARETAKNAGFDDALFLNSQHVVTETSTANLFFVRDQKIYTPHVRAGLLNGTRRQILCRILPIEEGLWTWDDVKQAEAIFVTNSLFSIMPVVQIDAHYYDSFQHPLFKTIQTALHTFRNESH